MYTIMLVRIYKKKLLIPIIALNLISGSIKTYLQNFKKYSMCKEIHHNFQMSNGQTMPKNPI